MDATAIGAGGILALLVIREVFAFLRAKKNGGGAVLNYLKHVEEKVDDIQTKTAKLYDLHNKYDDDGVPLWYVRRSLEQAVVRFADAVEKQTSVMTRLTDKVVDSAKTQDRIEEGIAELRRQK